MFESVAVTCHILYLIGFLNFVENILEYGQPDKLQGVLLVYQIK